MKKILIFLNGLFIVWGCLVLIYVSTPVLSAWTMADVFAKYGLVAWLMVNTTFIVLLVSTIGIMAGNTALMNVCIPFLLFYGVGGLFIFNWSLEIIPMQLLHIMMTVTVFYMLVFSLKKLAIIKLSIGIIVGTVIFLSFKVYQNHYFRTHGEIAEYSGFSEYRR